MAVDRDERESAENDIRQLLSTYEQSLNLSDADLAVSCYAPEAVFMPTMAPTVEGGSMLDGYKQIFNTIELKVRFTIDELVVASPTVAYALTRSQGTQRVLATDVTTPEANREIFVFTPVEAAWKISRYMFNKSE
jgi:ketosteroid isomerase-like protein